MRQDTWHGCHHVWLLLCVAVAVWLSLCVAVTVNSGLCVKKYSFGNLHCLSLFRRGLKKSLFAIIRNNPSSKLVISREKNICQPRISRERYGDGEMVMFLILLVVKQTSCVND